MEDGSFSDDYRSKMHNTIISETPPNPIDNLVKLSRERWVEDSSASHCQKCNATFRLYRRRHHCRNCCSLFCDSCSSYRERIPRVVKKIPTRYGGEEPIDYEQPVRLCFECYQHYQIIHRLDKLLTVFSLLELDIFDFKNLAMVCKAWRPAALFYLSKLREIQYKLPNYKYNFWEVKALWSNRLVLQGHQIWQVHLYRALAQTGELKRLEKVIELYRDDPEDSYTFGLQERDSRACWDRMCSRFCQSELDPERALLLLQVLDAGQGDFMEEIAEQIVYPFNFCTERILECYFPYILSKYISSKNRVLRIWIYRQCDNSVRLANITYWYLKIHSKSDFTHFTTSLSQTRFTQIMKIENFVETVLVGDEDKLCNIISPVRPELGDQKVDNKNIVTKKSATKPTFIPCSKSSVLFKRDDVRKDYIVVCVIRLMEQILKDAGIDVDLVTYSVQPTSNGEGFIEIVPNCETLYGISEKLHTNIINYLMKHNPDESVKNLRKRFTTSCAIYSVIAFLLSISDRNTENLMLTQKGDLFHIDFGYSIDGNDPKILKTSCIRITTQMLNALGGTESEEYEQFKEMCGDVYDILRRHVSTFVCLLSLLPAYKTTSKTSPMVDEKAMISEIVKRFCPGESYDEAIRNLKTRIDNSANSSTLSKYHIIDFFHKHNRESTVTNLVGDTISFAYKGTKSIVGGIYSYFG